MAKATRKTESGLVLISVDRIFPAEINDKVYRPVSPRDPAIRKLAESIAENGILQPIHVTRDGVVLSGHRRLCAAKVAGLPEVPVIVVDIYSDDDKFLPLLIEHNKQREKTLAEQLHEASIATSENGFAEIDLLTKRSDRSFIKNHGELISGGEYKGRAAISDAKLEFLMAIIRVLNALRNFWPLSVRQIHYQLLNDPPRIHSKKPGSVYSNKANCYKATTDLCMRARIAGHLPWDAIDDPTRPVVLWNVQQSPGQFLTDQTDDFLRGYARDLMQSQPNHIEIIGEKNTISKIVKEVASEYCIPFTVGRGFCSGPPRKANVDRWKASGKEKLILLVLSDHDPDGCQIAESLERSFRGDFGVPARKLKAIRAALTRNQILDLDLPASSEAAKRSSTNYQSFVDQYGEDVYELEAVPPAELQRLLRQEIESVIDWPAFDHEQREQNQDREKLKAAKATVLTALQSIELGGCE